MTDQITPFPWPPGVARVPEDPWTRDPVESLALKYDSVEQHGWYDNLDPTLEEVNNWLPDDGLLLDYSGGTGIFARRFLELRRGKPTGVVIVDASPKFLRLALDRLGHDPRVAFRWLKYRRDQRRLETLDETLEPALLARGVDAVTSTNAIHLYSRLAETLASWANVMRPRPNSRAFIQSGNIDNPSRPIDEWIIDATVEVIHRVALELVRSDARWSKWRSAIENHDYLTAHDDLRRRIFLPVQPLAYYLEALEAAGFEVLKSERRSILAQVDEWFDFLAVYHEGVLGWAGGAEKVTGVPPSVELIAARLELMRAAMDQVFDGRQEFHACWTYLTVQLAARSTASHNP